MKKYFVMLAALVIMVGGLASNKAEAFRHFHPQGADESSIYLFNDNLMDEYGQVMGIYRNNALSQQVYLGKWKRLPSGLVQIKYDLLKIMDKDNRAINEVSVNQEMTVQKKVRGISIISQDATLKTGIAEYVEHEYVWGNDEIMADYMLKKYFASQGVNAVVTKIPSQAKSLEKEWADIITERRDSPSDEGSWFEVKTDNSNIEIYYVESESGTIYKKDNASLVLLQNFSNKMKPMDEDWRTLARSLGNNRALVTMYKDNGAEYYRIYFTPGYFIVEKACADDPKITAKLQREVGVRQQYGPNPRVTLVKDNLKIAD